LKISRRGRRVDFGGGLVRAQAHDTRKPKGKAAVVALRALDIVEGDFETMWARRRAGTRVFGGVFQKYWVVRESRRW